VRRLLAIPLDGALVDELKVEDDFFSGLLTDGDGEDEVMMFGDAEE